MRPPLPRPSAPPHPEEPPLKLQPEPGAVRIVVAVCALTLLVHAVLELAARRGEGRAPPAAAPAVRTAAAPAPVPPPPPAPREAHAGPETAAVGVTH